MFGDPSVVQISTLPLESAFPSEERTAVEFSLALLGPGSVVQSAILRLSPQGGADNLGLDASETGEIHGYSGDGTIQVADMQGLNLVGTIPGPTPDGQVSVAIDVAFIQQLVDGSATHAGFMFKGLDGPTATLFNFSGTFSGIPEANRPTLLLEVQEGPVVPEPGTLLLLGSGLLAVRFRSAPLGQRRRG